MGVPKFYRWISERYPCLSEVIKEFQIPDFDNLYLDMNGIIHTCSHPNDDDPHFRITEENIFSGICYYIDFLFKMIKPKKVFFMAVDGVAPRAKMNQQRGRRFRTAKAAVMLEEQAMASGEKLPAEARFDSNCITPGTPFMARLHNCLKGFVVHKMSTDKLWQNVRVYLSGHETPGEGEHKIMDFIRYEKSQPGYNSNTRHCLYGLDADLIMLGLCSHEPYFSLLREEIKFGGSKKKQKRITTPEETTFHLLHISLLRDYLCHEFSPVKSEISFPFDLEQIVDDFVLMSFLVGNDFIPHLPQLHIHHDALPLLFKTYMNVLPSLGGYINEKGYLNLERFQLFLNKLAEYDFKKFGELNDDFQCLEKKSQSKKETNVSEKSTADVLANLGFSNLAISKIAEFETSSDEDNSDEEYPTLEQEFNMHKVDYYMNKLDIEKVTPEVLKDQAEGYVRAIQWNLHYYYNGVISWSWYYPHHYSPYISDVKDFKDMEMNFELGMPFLPFQQLLAVLPKLSKDLLPESYKKLMCDEDSPLIDFYPDDFCTDLNGKQQEWEAVVLIPFINEKLLLKCAEIADKNLTEEERKRNSHGPHLLYTYSEKSSGLLPSFLHGHYADISESHAKVTEIYKDFFRISAKLIYKGLCKDVILNKFIIGFPTLRTLKHSAVLKNAKVKVFQMTSLKENMMLIVEEAIEKDMNKICEKILGKIVYVGWPHLKEALVIAVSNGKVNYNFERDRQTRALKVIEEEMSNEKQKIWKRQIESVEENSYQRWGIVVGDTEVLVHARCFSGSKYVISKEGKVTEEKQFEGTLSNFALQTIVTEIEAFSPDIKMERTAEDIFKIGTPVFVLNSQYYGSMGKILDCDLHKNKGTILVDLEVTSEPDLLPIIQNQQELMLEQFMPGCIAAQQLGIESHFLSRITGTFLVQTSPKGSSNPNRVNIGLNLKFNRRNEEVQGFSKKVDNQWLYSGEVVKILNSYLKKFADFFEKLYAFINSDVVYVEDLYPSGEGPDIIKEIAAWLKEQSSSLADRQTCGIKKLDNGIVAAIENTVLSMMKEEVQHIKKSILPSQLHSPYVCKGIYMPDSKATFNLFDRVVNVSPSSSVPLGLKGTVIGIQDAEKESEFIYEILFDKEFSGGFAVAVAAKKGYRMPPNSLINLTYGERMSRQTHSPFKNAKNIPRLNKNAIYESVAKHLQTNNSPPVQVFQKKHSSPLSIQNKPFYKANSSDMFSNQFLDKQYISPVFSPTWSNNKQFVTPKASHFSGSYVGTPNNVAQKNVSNSLQSEFQNFWADLKKAAPEPPTLLSKLQPVPPSPVMQQRHVVEQTYGQKVSVEELFQGAKNQIETNHLQNLQTVNRAQVPPPSISVPALSPRPHAEAHDILRQLCLEHFKAPPLYNYHNYGNTALCIATISLPNGEKISSIPCPSKFEAAANASEKALACLKSSMKGSLCVPNQTYLNSMISHEPSLISRSQPAPQPNFQHEFRPFPVGPPPQFIPSHFPQPPPVPYSTHFNRGPYDSPVLRHPQPLHSTHIPDSYIKANQVMHPEFPVNQNMVPSSHIDSRTSEREVYHLPGGGIAMIRNTPHMKASENTTNMFVPHVVMKQAIKAPHDKTLSNSEWPDLPSKEPENVLKVTSQYCKNDRTRFDPERPKTNSPSPTSTNVVKPHHPPGMTVLKPKTKRRLAANFENP